VALVAVKYQQHVATYPLAFNPLNKVPELGYTKLVSSLAIVTYSNALLGLQIRELSFVVVLCFKDKVGRNCLAYRVNCSD
jgi:hypothetical protein